MHSELPIDVYVVTLYASRWTATALASSFGPYPERFEQGTMAAAAMTTTVATFASNTYSGAYTVSSVPAQTRL
jgi:hypothetical protein